LKIGLLFGSFNPIHNGHMVIANYMAEFTDLNEVWLIVTPQNPLKPTASLLKDNHRFQLVKIAIGDYKKLKASKIEFTLPKPSYTINTLTQFQQKYPAHEFVLIMGSDNLETFKKWKKWEYILRQYELYVYPRPEYEGGELRNHRKISFVNAPLMEISASFIRKAIKEQKDIRFMLPEAVYRYIVQKGFYKK
jgi:nicotinate-nucleotide adenylyltransferase